MRWSYADYCETPAVVIDEVIRWMIEIAEERKKAERDSERKAQQARMRR